MRLAAITLFALAAISFLAGCQQTSPSAPGARGSPLLATSDALAPSPRLIVGRVIAIDAKHNFAFVELVADAPPNAAAPDAELIARTLALQETARLRASRYLRGRTLGTTIVTGNPTVGDEVVWLAP